MNTTGFKRENVMFQEFLEDTNGQNLHSTMKKVSFVQDYGITRQMTDGELTVTSNPLDVALTGNGMFEVEKPDGSKAYTRNGHFSLSSNNTLMTTSGYEIMDDTGNAITVPQNASEIKIASDGTISARNIPIIGKLKVVAFTADNKLSKIGDNLYSTETPPQAATDFEIIQGAIENSNVIPIIEITKMINLSRSYMSVAKMINKLQDLEGKAINRLAKVG
jgi:flagellar basal-body rod protein FlgF